MTVTNAISVLNVHTLWFFSTIRPTIAATIDVNAEARTATASSFGYSLTICVWKNARKFRH